MSKAAPSKRPVVSYRFQRVFPGIQTGHGLSVQTKRREPVRFFMHQANTLDKACGIHIAGMLIVLHDLVTPTALHEMSQRKSGTAAEVWRAFRHTYFAGVNPDEWVELIDSLNLPLALTAKYSEQDDADGHALGWLMRGGDLVALAFASVKHGRTKHWALAVGVEGAVVGKVHTPDNILLLDPSAGEPLFTVSNARLRLVGAKDPGRRVKWNVATPTARHKPKPVNWLYESVEWSAEEVRLLAAVRIRRLPG